MRLTHWTVAAGVLLNCFNETGYWHRMLGYGCVFVILLRVIYGLWLSRLPASKFFVPEFTEIRQHLHEIKTGQFTHHDGHNPLGQCGVYGMWLLIMLLGFTGWLSRTDAFWGEDFPVQIHALAAYLLQLIVVLHIAAVFLMSRWQRRNLVKAMIKPPSSKDCD